MLKGNSKSKKLGSRFRKDVIKMEDVGLGNEERKYEEGEVTKDETKKGNKKDKQMKVGVESEKAKEARLETKRSVLSKVEEEGTLEEASDLIF